MASPFPIVSHFHDPDIVFHQHLTFSTNASHFPYTSHIFHKCLTLSIYASHFPHTSHIIHKCFPFSTNASIFHTYFTFSTNTCVPFSFFYFHAHSTVASLCSYIGASLRVINTSIARQGGYNQSIHRFLAVEKKDKDTTKGLVTNHWKSSYELKDGRQGLVWTTQIFLYCWLHQVL